MKAKAQLGQRVVIWVFGTLGLFKQSETLGRQHVPLWTSLLCWVQTATSRQVGPVVGVSSSACIITTSTLNQPPLKCTSVGHPLTARIASAPSDNVKIRVGSGMPLPKENKSSSCSFCRAVGRILPLLIHLECQIPASGRSSSSV